METLERLSRRFKAAEVEKREGFHYISVDATIKRFNEVLGFAYSLELDSVQVTKLEGETTRSGKQQYRVDAYGHVTIYDHVNVPHARRAGVGSAVNFDVDNAIKTAQAEVFKKAGHQFGVGLNLWDERERDLVDYVNARKYKTAVAKLAEIDGVTVTPEAITARYGSDPTSEEGCRTILAEAGLL